MKYVKDSQVEMNELVFPNHANPKGKLFGGQLASWIDIVGALAAMKHSDKEDIVTAAIDSVDFKSPIKVGDVVTLKSRITWTGKTSMEVMVEVFVRHAGETKLANKAYMTMVALDENEKPTAIPSLIIETEEQQKEWNKAEERRAARLKRREEEE